MDSPVLRVSSSDHHVLDTQDHDLAIDDDEVKVTTEVRRAQTVGKSEYILNQYMRGELIGKGQHGSVYVCYDDKGARRAMKVVSRKNPRQDRVKELRKHKLPASGNHIPVTDNFSSTEHKIRKEIAVMKKCRHPHVVRLVEVIDDKLYKKVYMIMEYLAGGEVKWRDNDHNPILTVDQIRRICRDVILGLEYLHQQGIIHRDIKPANLLWTEDRRMVKITDFGVAHISAAHAARTEAHRRTDSSYDDLRLLFDDSELCKTAGTPSFLAPEVVHEYGSELGSETVQSNLTGTATDGVNGSSSTVQQRIISRPPITKAVDIWALGVTLYGMLFGVVPFHQDGAHEYMIYKIICNDDWNVPSTMGYDRIPTGGRHPELEVPEPSEGALVVSLLEGLLEKDASKRATLAEVKRHPWFLRDISNADAWVEDTVSPMASAAPSLLPSSASSPSSPPVGSQQEGQSLSVTEDDYEAAVSQVKFRWDFKNVGKRLVSRFFRKRSSPVPRVPQGRGRGHNAQSVGITSEPSSEMGRYTRRPRSAGGELRSYGSHHNPFRPRTPPKQRNDTPTRQLSQQFPRPSLHVPSPGRSKSVDRPRTTGSAVSSSSHLSNAEDLHGSTRSFSPGSKSRFSMRSLWPSGRNGSSIFGFGGDSTASSSSRQLGTSHHRQASASQGAMRTSNETSPTTSVGRPPGGIQSTGYATPASPQDSFNVRPELRAASWGDVQDYHTRNTGKHAAHAEEVTSVYSGGGDDAPDDDVMLFGAGGIASAPGSSTNFTPFSALDDKGHPVSTGTGKVMAVPVELLHSVPGRDPAAIANPATQGSTSQLARAAQRVHARSPLVQAYSSGDDADVDAGERLEGGQVPVDSDSASEESFGSDSDDSFFERTSESAGLVRRRRTASEIFGSGSEEGDEGAAQAAIEVRRRRPSFALRGEDEDESGDEDEDGGSEGGNSDDSVDIR